MGGRWNWPAFRCCAIDALRVDVCELPAKWRAHPVASSRSWWAYCERHKPDHAEPLGADVPYRVVRLTVTVAIASLEANRQAAEEEAARQVAHALEHVGAVMTGLELHGASVKASRGPTSGMRLQLAGPAELLEALGGDQLAAPKPRYVAFGRFGRHKSSSGGPPGNDREGGPRDTLRNKSDVSRGRQRLGRRRPHGSG